MSKVTECPICLERYNNKLKIPKILSCGHTFCKQCLISLKNKSDDYKCSICRKNQPLDNIDNLSTNLVIYDLLYNPEQDEDIFIEEKNNFKIILLGSTFTGKTSLINRFVNKKFVPDYEATIGVDIKTAKINVGEKYIGLNIWDTAGSEKFQTLTMNYLRNCYGAFIVFDIGRKDTFEDVEKWKELFLQFKDNEINQVIYLIGNKNDNENERKVEKEEAEKFAIINKMKYFETSAKEGTNVEKIFEEIGKEIFRLNKDGNIYIRNKEKNGIISLNNNDNCEDCWSMFINSIKGFFGFCSN